MKGEFLPFLGSGRLNPEDERLRRLERENRDLREENEIFKKPDPVSLQVGLPSRSGLPFSMALGLGTPRVFNDRLGVFPAQPVGDLPHEIGGVSIIIL